MAMGDNPYAAPKASTRAAVGIRGGKTEDIRPVAIYQKAIMLSILVYIGIIGFNIVLNVAKVSVPPIVTTALVIVVLVDVLVGVVFVFLLAMKLYHPAVGVLLALLTFVPLLGLLILLMVNGKATGTLRANGITVGLLGANLADVPR